MSGKIQNRTLMISVLILMIALIIITAAFIDANKRLQGCGGDDVYSALNCKRYCDCGYWECRWMDDDYYMYGRADAFVEYGTALSINTGTKVHDFYLNCDLYIDKNHNPLLYVTDDTRYWPSINGGTIIFVGGGSIPPGEYHSNILLQGGQLYHAGDTEFHISQD